MLLKLPLSILTHNRICALFLLSLFWLSSCSKAIFILFTIILLIITLLFEINTRQKSCCLKEDKNYSPNFKKNDSIPLPQKLAKPWVIFTLVSLTFTGANILTTYFIPKVEIIFEGKFDNLSNILAQKSLELLTNGSGIFDPYKFENFDGISLIIPVRDEDEFISKTISYTLDVSPRKWLKEIIIVDDCSKKKVSDIIGRELSRSQLDIIKIIRLNTCEGLIRSRILGADASSSSVIVFMDGHCRPKQGWIEPLVHRLKLNTKAIVCPMIEDIDRYTWEDAGTYGLKMMFNWNFEFNWYEDFTDVVPIASGGLYAITRQWWNESGKYDPGMLEWGGENIEQSIRTWCCGGEIRVELNSRVGHIFKRDPKPNPENKLVKQVQRNQKRTALVWLDQKRYKYFEDIHSVVKSLNETFSGVKLDSRYQIKSQLNCKPFSWYINKFRPSFDRRGLLLDNFRQFIHKDTGLCLTASYNEVVTGTSDRAVIFTKCNSKDFAQQWMVILGRRLIMNRFPSYGCLSRGPSSVVNDSILRVTECKFKGAIAGNTDDQFWHFDGYDNFLFDEPYDDLDALEFAHIKNSSRIFNSIGTLPFSEDGYLRIKINGTRAFESTSRCVRNLNDKAVMTWCPTVEDSSFSFDVVKLY
ncbi:glycosyl transferase [Cryptosporidium muris RN66]|uniref:Glycosyl transferase, group 2 family protein n=1 Tax=Cryptosporidium muris (strain RN66) TaxID=441375 RepID=B6AFF4_CRYMR|nr:glycosyl transferase [Cryptosporidium muris RN66]EEA06945.1 glycosyl transferase, group 2 family protein [Cryptosporidium muris RN66]|eukprot:XP_002141294.1 glycosyl transferase [Cryptosporidium muris RN66]